ncbi:Chromosome transmission fidelity protein 18 [Nakaseomyces bracarensis]|uniref:Chromosome transmission fidelity protein 18 n=1 Tax=Nakaseomyces bracarensis TaxID=273131 RepID=A0ABR4NN70_9SACH
MAMNFDFGGGSLLFGDVGVEQSVGQGVGQGDGQGQGPGLGPGPDASAKTSANASISYSYDGLRFVSSDGNSVVLEKKDRGVEEPGLGYSTAHKKASLWASDEGYGMNISAMMDRIESTSSSRESDTSNVADDARSPAHGRTGQSQSQLWVEKWRPSKFLDLVGNEKNNRRILRWLRQWSPAVFKEEVDSEAENGGAENENYDPLHRPFKRILMLNGPPGIGKTSVAHVVAKQAGYRVAEINASDERAGSLVRDKVHNTLFNHSFLGGAVCLVADEIDGSVESGFIKVLIDIINNDKRATEQYMFRRNDKSNRKSANKKNRARLLLRPIIVICNNLYAPALEKLRPLCEIVTLRKPSDNSIRERLLHISSKEDINLSIKSINELIDLSEGDIRNCINNLQFQSRETKSKGAKDKDLNDVSGLKDMSLSWFKIVNEIFRKDPHKNNKEQFLQLAKKIEKVDNYDRVVSGCHTLFPYVKYSDIGLNKPSAIADWLFFHEQMFKSMFEHNGELLRYSAIVPMVFHQKFGDISNKDDQRIKNSDFEQREAKKVTESIADLIMKKISTHAPILASNIKKKHLVFEVLPYLDNMISSDISKVKDIKRKQTMLKTMLDLMDVFQLEFLETRNEVYGSKNILIVEPPISKVVLLEEKRINEVLTKRPPNLNLLLAKKEEIKVKKRHFEQIEKNKNVSSNEGPQNKKQKVTIESMSTPKEHSVDVLKSQYGVIKSNLDNEKTSVNNQTEVKIWVKYKEGFSNAVRKKVTWETLWT